MVSKSENKNDETQIGSSGRSQVELFDQSDDLLTESDLPKQSSVDQSASRMRNFQKLKISKANSSTMTSSCVLRNHIRAGGQP